MSLWTKLRNTAQAAAVVAGNYYLPGSSLITSRLVADGAQEQLNTKFGRLANLAAGGYGGYSGNLANYGTVGTAIGESTGLNSLFNGSASGAGAAGTTSAGTSAANLNTALSDPSIMADTASVSTAPDLSSMTSNTASPALASPSVVSSGSNIPVDYGTASAGNYGYDMGTGTGVSGSIADPFANESLAETTRLAAQNAGATGTPVATPSFLESMGSGSIGDAASAAGSWAAANPIAATYVGGSLYDMYAKKQMARKQEDLYNQNRNDIMNMYAPGSPEYVAMEREMARKDAAAGRNSQYGQRSVDMAAALAKWKAGAISNLQGSQNTLYNSAMNNQYGMANTPLTLATMYQQSKRPGYAGG